MITWLNFSVLVFVSVIYTLLYVRSASPAGREQTIGPRAYRLCFYDRLAAGALEMVITANYILFFFFPLDSPLPLRFPWAWWLSILIAILIGVPACILMVSGIRDAGEETMLPKKEHTMYGGIYTKLRHPQAVGEVFLFPVIALALNSPFLTIFSLIYFPIFMIMCHAEEQDLLLRYGKAYADYCRRTGAFWPKRSQKNA